MKEGGGAGLNFESGPSEQADCQTDDGQRDEDQKQDLGNAGCTGGQAAEAKHGGHQGNDEKNDGVVQHDLVLGC